jgi:tetratricopeptide (TPR) repeat protein
MTVRHKKTRYFLYLFFLISFILPGNFKVYSQKIKSDSLLSLLAKETIDTNKVKLLWQLADVTRRYNPDTSLLLAQDALYLARRHHYTEGESRSLGILANTFMSIGNYPRALELNLEKLKLEENRNRPRNLASVLMNIGIVYVLQEEYDKALDYYAQADSVIEKFNVAEFKHNIALNTGDAYDRINKPDSAYFYFEKSLEIAKANSSAQDLGLSLTGLGHTFTKLGNYAEALLNYQGAIKNLQEASDDETFCEATLGIARLYLKLIKNDSAHHYAVQSYTVAKKDGFLSKELDAASFLLDFFKKTKNIDSAFFYSDQVYLLNDSLNSKEKIRQAQVLSSNEQFRQRALAEERMEAAKKRYQQLQLLLIGIFIPGLFLITLLLSVSKIHIQVIRGLGILSLLFFFEYLTLLLHPTVAELTHHTPVFEILIFVALASILIPLHHRVEHWLIHRLIHHRVHLGENQEKKNGQT